MVNRGIARLTVAVQGGRTVVVDRYSQAPLQIHRPLYLEDNNFPTVFLRSPSSGLLDGDIHDLDVEVADYATLELRTQGAMLVYPGVSEQHLRITIGKGSSLQFLPHPLILAQGAELSQSIRIRMACDSRLLFQEWWISGRLAMGEAWQFRKFSNSIEIFEDDKLRFLERWSIDPSKDNLTSPIICGGEKSFKTVFAFDMEPSEAKETERSKRYSFKRGRGTLTRTLYQC